MLQSHDEIFDSEHDLISIQTLSKDPELRMNPVCKEHNEEHVCCKLCFIIRCPSCPSGYQCAGMIEAIVRKYDIN